MNESLKYLSNFDRLTASLVNLADTKKCFAWHSGTNTIKLILMLYFRGKVVSTKDLFVAATKAASKELQIDSTKLQVQTQIMYQSLAVMLWQLCYGKISFIVLVSVKEKEIVIQSYYVMNPLDDVIK